MAAKVLTKMEAPEECVCVCEYRGSPRCRGDNGLCVHHRIKAAGGAGGDSSSLPQISRWLHLTLDNTTNVFIYSHPSITHSKGNRWIGWLAAGWLSDWLVLFVCLAGLAETWQSRWDPRCCVWGDGGKVQQADGRQLVYYWWFSRHFLNFRSRPDLVFMLFCFRQSEGTKLHKDLKAYMAAVKSKPAFMLSVFRFIYNHYFAK